MPIADNLPSAIIINGSSIQFSESLSSLGLTIENTLSMHMYVLSVCKLAYFELRRISFKKAGISVFVLQVVWSAKTISNDRTTSSAFCFGQRAVNKGAVCVRTYIR